MTKAVKRFRKSRTRHEGGRVVAILPERYLIADGKLYEVPGFSERPEKFDREHGGSVQALRNRIEVLEGELAIARAKDEPIFPTEVLDRLLAGDNPVRVFREHSGLARAALAAGAKVSPSYLAEIETGKKPGSAAALKAIATALQVPMELLVAED